MDEPPNEPAEPPAVIATDQHGALARRLGIDVISVDPDRLVATMPVAGNTQPYGVLHGGASCALAETIGSIAAALHAGAGRRIVGMELNATHHRAVRDGLVTAVCTPLHRGRTTASFQIEIADEAGRAVCTARLSCLLLD